MSYSFAIRGEKPAISKLVCSVKKQVGNVSCLQKNFADSPLEKLHFYVEQKSTRGVEITWNTEDNSLNITTFVFSTDEDYKLAFAFTIEAARIMQGNISCPKGCFDVDNFCCAFDQNWIDSLEKDYKDTLFSQVKDHHTTVKIACIFRDFYLGPNTIEKMVTRNDLLQTIKEVIYFKDRNVFIANKMIMKHYNKSFCVWGPGVSYLFPDCDLLGIISEHGAPNTIPRKLIFELIPDKIKRLDEHHILVESLNEKEYNVVCQRITDLLMAS